MSVINSNLAALRASERLATNQSMLTRSLDRLSSGSRLNGASEGAAEMAVSLRMDSRLQRIAAAEDNLANAMSFTQAQDGHLRKLGSVLNRMSELSILAKDGLKSNDDRELYNEEFQQLKAFIRDTADKEFNGVKLFDGGTIPVTKDADGNIFNMETVDLFRGEYRDVWLGEGFNDGPAGMWDGGSHLLTTGDAANAMQKVEVAVVQMGKDIAKLGAAQARISSTAENLAVSKSNMEAVNSRIKDVDVAEESTELAKYNILVQSGTAMLAQANQLPQNVLRLLQ